MQIRYIARRLPLKLIYVYCAIIGCLSDHIEYSNALPNTTPEFLAKNDTNSTKNLSPVPILLDNNLSPVSWKNFLKELNIKNAVRLLNPTTTFFLSFIIAFFFTYLEYTSEKSADPIEANVEGNYLGRSYEIVNNVKFSFSFLATLREKNGAIEANIIIRDDNKNQTMPLTAIGHYIDDHVLEFTCSDEKFVADKKFLFEKIKYDGSELEGYYKGLGFASNQKIEGRIRLHRVNT